MKRFLITLGLALGLVFTVSAQKKKDSKKDFTPEQKLELAVKKMTLNLDLNQSQINQIKPILKSKIAKKEAFKKQKEEFKKSGKELTSDERFKMHSQRLDSKIAFKNEMKQILSAEQYVKFEKMQAHRGKRKGKMKGKSCEAAKKSCEGSKKSCEGK